MVRGANAGLTLLREVEAGPLAGNHRLLAVRAHLLEQSGNRDGPAATYREAARLAGSVPAQRLLVHRAARCADPHAAPTEPSRPRQYRHG